MNELQSHDCHHTRMFSVEYVTRTYLNVGSWAFNAFVRLMSPRVARV